MRIGVIASPWIPVPPPAYGGTETVVHNLCTGLEQLGHEVHLVTVGTSTCPVTRSAVFDSPPCAIGEPAPEIVHARGAYAMLRHVDVIHDHTTIGPHFLPDLAAGATPVVTTVHGPFRPETRMLYRDRPRNLAVVAISYAQRAMAPDVEVDAVIHHGIDLDLHRPGPGGGGYLMFIGRMSPDKGPDRAIEVARRAGLPLVMSAKMREPQEIAYFEERVRPLLGPDVTLVGEADAAARLDLLRHAEALVNPIQWPEPFGLVMAESLACGTPVIALPHGAAPEIVDDGRTGFLPDDLTGMVEAIGRLGTIDRAACRERAERCFSTQRMARDHAELYAKLAGRVEPLDTLDLTSVAGTADLVSRASGTRTAVAAPAAGLPSLPVVTAFDAGRGRGRPRFTVRRNRG